MNELERYRNISPVAAGICWLVASPFNVTRELIRIPPDTLWINNVLQNQRALHQVQSACFLGTGKIGNEVCQHLSSIYAAPLISVHIAEGRKAITNRRLIDSHLMGKDILIVTGSIRDPIFWRARELALSYIPLVWTIGVLPDEGHTEKISFGIEHNETFCVMKAGIDQLLNAIHSIHYACSAQSRWSNGLSGMQLLFNSQQALSFSMSSARRELKFNVIKYLAQNDAHIRFAERIQANLFIRRSEIMSEDVSYLQKALVDAARPGVIEGLLIQWRPDLSADFRLSLTVVSGDPENKHIQIPLPKRHGR